MGAVDGAAGAALVGGGSVVTADALVPLLTLDDAIRKDASSTSTLNVELPRGFGRD